MRGKKTMEVTLREPELIKQIERLAQTTSQSVEKVLETAVHTYLDELERETIHTETEAFWAMHDELLKKYPDQHVALHQGKVIDHDKDASCLEKRVRERFGWQPVLIAPVKSGPRRDLSWIGGRIEAIK
jgi:predicted transcriptional regulator